MRQRGIVDEAAVDVGAVQGSPVDDAVALGRFPDLSVVAGDAHIVQKDGRVGASTKGHDFVTETHHSARDGAPHSGQGALATLQPETATKLIRLQERIQLGKRERRRETTGGAVVVVRPMWGGFAGHLVDPAAAPSTGTGGMVKMAVRRSRREPVPRGAFPPPEGVTTEYYVVSGEMRPRSGGGRAVRRRSHRENGAHETTGQG